MAILPVPTIPDPEPPPDMLERIMDAINALAVLHPAERERLIRDERLACGALQEFALTPREQRRWEFLIWGIRNGVYSDDIAA